jgi:Glycosyl transferase family 11
MIIINLKGGTGNQLFQYALGRHLAIKNHDVLKLDVHGLARANDVGDIYRPFALEPFNTIQEIATTEEIKRIKYPYGVFSKAWRFLSFKLSRDKNTLFRSKVLDWTGDIYLDGYWQSPRYFEDIRDVLLKDFTLTEPLPPVITELLEQIRGTSAVSLHVRRGDYVKNPTVSKEFGPCSLSYYERAVAAVREQIAAPTFFIFSDDPLWVQENLHLGEKTVFIAGTGLRDVDELLLMSACQHNIIANSSFSWWGAWLNQNPAKIVIAPTPWFDNQPYDTALLPTTWTQLPK